MDPGTLGGEAGPAPPPLLQADARRPPDSETTAQHLAGVCRRHAAHYRVEACLTFIASFAIACAIPVSRRSVRPKLLKKWRSTCASAMTHCARPGQVKR